MANRFWVGGNANWDATAGTKWATTSGGAGGSAVPTAADDVFLDNGTGTGNVTIAANVVCRSLNCTNYTGTLTYDTNARTITIGDATAGASSISLKFVAGMTYTKLGDGNSITVASTSATIQTFTTAGKTLGNLTFAGAGSTTWLVDDVTTSNTAVFTLTNGQVSAAGATTLNLGSVSITGASTRTLFMGTPGTITWNLNATSGTVWDATTTTNLTVSATTATIKINSASSSTRTFIGGGQTYGHFDYTVAGSTGKMSFTGSNTFTNFNFTDASNARTLEFTAGTTTTFNGVVNINGTSGKLMTIQSATASNHTLSQTIGGSNLARANCDYLSISRSQATGTGHTWFAGANSTDGGNNSGWVFTGPARYWVGGGSANTWIATGNTNWALTSGGANNAGVPAQGYDLIFDSNSGAGTSVCSGNLTIGSIDCTGYTGTLTISASVTLTFTQGETSVPIKLSSGMTFTYGSATTTILSIQNQAGTNEITSAGKTWPTMTKTNTAGTVKLMDAFTIDNLSTLNTNGGTFDLNSQTLNLGLWSHANTHTIILGTATINLNGVGTVFANGGTTTWTNDQSTITITDTSASAKTFNSYPTASLTHNKVVINGASGAGTVTLGSTPTYTTFIINPGASVRFTGTTNTFTNFTSTGTQSLPITWRSNAGLGSAFTLSLGAASIQTPIAYVDIQDCTISGAISKLDATRFCTDSSGSLNVMFPQKNGTYPIQYDPTSNLIQSLYRWVCPPGVTHVQIEAWGGGGGGGGAAAAGDGGGGGGGGGNYGKKNAYAVTWGTIYLVQMGQGGAGGTTAGGTGSSAGNTVFDISSSYRVTGGGGGIGSAGAGTGGSAGAANTGCDTSFTSGAGGNSTQVAGNGGGGGGGSSGDSGGGGTGGNTASGTGGTAGAAGTGTIYTGFAGGVGGTGGGSNTAGNPGSGMGAGGGGAGGSTSGRLGGDGQAGRLIITNPKTMGRDVSAGENGPGCSVKMNSNMRASMF